MEEGPASHPPVSTILKPKKYSKFTKRITKRKTADSLLFLTDGKTS